MPISVSGAHLVDVQSGFNPAAAAGWYRALFEPGISHSKTIDD
jgi:hypothetical protein